MTNIVDSGALTRDQKWYAASFFVGVPGVLLFIATMYTLWTAFHNGPMVSDRTHHRITILAIATLATTLTSLTLVLISNTLNRRDNPPTRRH